MKINSLNMSMGGAMAAALVCLLSTVSCIKEQIENRGSESGAYTFTVNAGCAGNVTKTEMTGDGTTDNPYAAVWSSDDLAGLFVGNDKNVQMAVSSIDNGRATFTGKLSSNPSAGENIYFHYPWSDGENQEATAVKCSFPYAQNPSKLGNYDPKYDYMWGTTQVKEDGAVSLDLNYAVGFINFKVKDLAAGKVSVKIGDETETLSADDKVVTVSIEAKPADAAKKVKLVGDFTMNLEDGNCTVPEAADDNNVGQKVLVNCPEGTTLGNLDVFACVHPFELAAGDVLKFWIQTENHYIIREVTLSGGFSVTAGGLKAFDATLDADKWTISVNPSRGGEIKTPEQFLRFVQDVKNGSYLNGERTPLANSYATLAPDAAVENRDIDKWLDEDGVAKLGNDITVTDELKTAYGSLAGVPLWTKVFDGQGHTITFDGGALTRPIFTNVFGGEVRNLTVAGEMGEGLESAAILGACPLVGVLHSGVIRDCTNKVNIRVTKAVDKDNIALAGICRTMQGGTIENCTNDGEISFNAALTAPSNIYAGGIVALVGKNYGDYRFGSTKGGDPVDPFSTAVKITGCHNNNPVSLVNNATSVNNRMQYCAVGGIAGWIWGGVSDWDKFVTVSGCTNSGALRVDETQYTTGTTGIAGVGGILGWAAPVATNGRLLGALYGSNATGDKIDGFYLKIVNCSNDVTATISASRKTGGSSTTPSPSTVYDNKVGCGGIAGILFGQYNGSMSEISGCINDGTIVGYEKNQDDSNGAGRGSRYNISGGIAGFCGAVKISGCTVGKSTQAKIGDGGYNMAAAGIAGGVYSKFEISDCIVNVGVTRQNTASLALFGSLVTNYIHTLSRSGTDIYSGSKISGCQIKGSVLYTKKSTDALTTILNDNKIIENPDTQSYCILCGEDLTKDSAYKQGYITISGTTHLK